MQGLKKIELMFAVVVLTAATTTAATTQDDAATVAKTRSVIRLGAAEALESGWRRPSFNTTAHRAVGGDHPFRPCGAPLFHPGAGVDLRSARTFCDASMPRSRTW